MADVRPTKLQNDGNGYGSLREFADGETVPVALGGTGAPTAAGARTSLGLGSAAVRSALGSTGALYSRDSILGAVSQASGIPSGAIIERGANANGDYVRYADGTQICWFNASVTDQAIDAVYGSLFTGTRSWSFPIAFSGSPTVSVGLFRWGTGAGWGTVGGIASASGITLRAFDIVSRATGTATSISAIAVGRWF